MQERNKEGQKAKSILPDNKYDRRVVSSVPNPKVKYPEYKDLESFFGKRGENMGYAYPAYPLYYGETKITKIYCHKKIIDSLERIYQNTLNRYGLDEIVNLKLDIFNGCYNNRLMRGSASKWSTHSWGIALDLNASENKLNMKWKDASFSNPEYKPFIDFWYNEGFINLGKEYDFDSMHFQACSNR